MPLTPLHFAAGDALQFDWSEEYVLSGGVEHKVHVAHFRLCHSRKPFVVAYLNESEPLIATGSRVVHRGAIGSSPMGDGERDGA